MQAPTHLDFDFNGHAIGGCEHGLIIIVLDSTGRILTFQVCNFRVEGVANDLEKEWQVHCGRCA